MADPTLEEMIGALIDTIVSGEQTELKHGPMSALFKHNQACLRAALCTLEAQRWQDIAEAPKKPCAVEFFFGDWPEDGGLRNALREFRRAIGFYDGSCFRESGTDHDVADRQGFPYGPPTHWRLLAEPPGDV